MAQGASISGKSSPVSVHKIGDEDGGKHQTPTRQLKQGQTFAQNNPGTQGRYHGNTVDEDRSPRGRYLSEGVVVEQKGGHRGKNH